MPFTSTFGSSMVFEGTAIEVGTAGSPGSFVQVANIESFSEPVMSRIVEVTNVGDHWARRRPTLNDMGKIGGGIFWQAQDTTQNNTTPFGLRYMLINQILADWMITFPDGAMTPSVDSFPAYTTSFAITSKVGDVWHAAWELANDGAPTLV